MATEVLTKDPTEAELEAKVRAAVCKALPWVSERALRHQIRFSFSIGRASVEIDGTATAEGRTDILVQLHGKPLAVLELKRPGLELTSDDEDQGLSYAKVMNPPYPLVFITNGDDTRILASHTGQPWEPVTRSEQEFANLVRSAALVATAAIKEAVSTLMGSSPAVWMQAVRAASRERIREMTGDWDEPSRPFVRNFLFPRKATLAIIDLLNKGQRFFLIDGAPLVGKSSILRELCVRSTKLTDMAVLFVEADEGRGILQTVADLLTSALSWPVTAEEARNWLTKLSHANGPALVLAVDGLGSNHDAARRELEDLSSPTFGPQVRLVVTVDDSAVMKLKTHPNGRQDSAIARRVDVEMGIGLLDDAEFEKAAETLWALRMSLQHGAASALELRVPWILRALAGQFAPDSEDPPDRAAVLPAQLSFELVAHARARFSDPELSRQFLGLARGVLHDVQAPGVPLALKLEGMATFMVRRKTLEKHLERQDIDELIARGYVRPAIHDSGGPVLYIRVPELLASEASRVLAEELMDRATEDPPEAARWLSATTSYLPLGDIIAAYAFVDAVRDRRGVPIGVVFELTEMPPSPTPVRPGMRAATLIGGRMVDLTFEEDGSVTAEVDGKTHEISVDPDDAGIMLGDHHPWMILSHLAGLRFAAGDDPSRLDLRLLGLVGSCPHVLRRPDNSMPERGTWSHSIPGYGEVLCHASGIIEPITFSLFKMLSREGPAQEEWIELALSSGSLGLLARIDVALREIENLIDPVAEWAKTTRIERITPALKDAVACAAQ
jgi:hypothetical protein